MSNSVFVLHIKAMLEQAATYWVSKPFYALPVQQPEDYRKQTHNATFDFIGVLYCHTIPYNKRYLVTYCLYLQEV